MAPQADGARLRSRGPAGALYYLYMAIVEDIPSAHPLDKGSLTAPLPQRRLRDLRSFKWSSPRSHSFDTTANLLGFISRPWFPSVVALAAISNCFLLILPVNLLYILSVARNSFSVLHSAFTVAGGVAFGVALLAWAVETSCPSPAAPTDRVFGVAMSVGEIRDHWPLVHDLVTHHGPAGCLAAFLTQHPLPAVTFGIHAGHSAAPLILAAWAGTFASLVMMGAVLIFTIALFKPAFDVFESLKPGEFDRLDEPRPDSKPSRSPRPARSPARSPKRSPKRSPARASSPKRSPATRASKRK